MDYTDSFRLFCTTRLPNPHYTPELSAKVTLVDFTVTMTGLEDQLLGKLILKEKHELEEQRQGLMEEVQSYKKKIKQLEDDLLFRLSNSQVSLCIIHSVSLTTDSATGLVCEAAPLLLALVQTRCTKQAVLLRGTGSNRKYTALEGSTSCYVFCDIGWHCKAVKSRLISTACEQAAC